MDPRYCIDDTSDIVTPALVLYREQLETNGYLIPPLFTVKLKDVVDPHKIIYELTLPYYRKDFSELHIFDDLRAQLVAVAESQEPREGLVLATARQRDVARRVAAAVSGSVAERELGSSEEYVASCLREALGILAELCGAPDFEDVYAHVFQRFCVGK